MRRLLTFMVLDVLHCGAGNGSLLFKAKLELVFHATVSFLSLFLALLLFEVLGQSDGSLEGKVVHDDFVKRIRQV